jgi:hypothetical protein
MTSTFRLRMAVDIRTNATAPPIQEFIAERLNIDIFIL